MKLHLKIPHTLTVLLGISQTRYRERQVPKKGTHTPALLPEAGYVLAFKSYVKLGRPQTVSWRQEDNYLFVEQKTGLLFTS